VARRERAIGERDELFQSLARGRLHTQKKSYLYSERRDQERQLFAQQIEQVAVPDRVYLDEAAVEDTLDYAWGWSLKGTRCMAQKPLSSLTARFDDSGLVSGASAGPIHL